MPRTSRRWRRAPASERRRRCRCRRRSGCRRRSRTTNPETRRGARHPAAPWSAKRSTTRSRSCAVSRSFAAATSNGPTRPCARPRP
nr:MAG: hypothetical protein DIU74_11760 [Pseudomonadota bacterium]